jgi:hypothetical protein
MTHRRRPPLLADASMPSSSEGECTVNRGRGLANERLADRRKAPTRQAETRLQNLFYLALFV